MKGREESFWSWLRNVRLSRLLLVFVPCFVIAPVLTYWFLTASLESFPALNRDSADIARKVLGLIDFDHLSGPELKRRIDELLRIKGSVQNELQNLEKKRQKMLLDMSDLTREIELLRGEEEREGKELEKLKASIKQTRLAQQELIERNTPEIKPPLPLLPTRDNYRRLARPGPGEVCTMESCFDYSRCSITSGLRVFVYPTSSTLGATLRSVLLGSGSLVTDPDSACIHVFIDDQATELNTLSHWQGDGRNHIIFNLPVTPTAIPPQRSIGRALLAQQTFDGGAYREAFDLVLPELAEESQPTWKLSPSMVPIARQYLLSFQGELHSTASGEKAEPLTHQILEALRRMPNGKTRDEFSLVFSCGGRRAFEVGEGDWYLCGNETERFKTLEQSTFNLVPAPVNSSWVSTLGFQRRLYESLRTGSIPVILGSGMVLPLGEVLDWSRFSILLPRPRVTELHYLLRTFSYSDLFSMKRQGRMVFQNYFCNTEQVLSSVLALVGTRLLIPANPVRDTESISVFNSSFVPLLMESLPPDVEPEESLGPLEVPFPSPTFRRNLTSVLSESSENWNSRFHALQLYPFTPWEPIIPTESKFVGSVNGFRPICGGEGGSGKEFSQALGGNSPQEQFTVVMLTYERENVLISSLSRLYGLPYLNKVVVVWNSPDPPKQDLRWPDIGVPIQVLKVERNSLNNRFLPYSAIETEAVLSVDDDSHLRHDEIIFGFRVWRENRDRLVGFPGRFHAWDMEHRSWNYNSNYSCELSMVLTGAAFYHKYYNYLYSHQMPQAIRTMVDELMNCEDLAMNFLVSHVTRQPPVKVTSRWTFRCPGCPVSLSEDDSHFQERHKCINELSRVYGYNPLLYTQYRADSVLFKTRIPPDKQKCFKFI